MQKTTSKHLLAFAFIGFCLVGSVQCLANEKKAFFRAINLETNRDEVALIAADALEESEDPEGALIRLGMAIRQHYQGTHLQENIAKLEAEYAALVEQRGRPTRQNEVANIFYLRGFPDTVVLRPIFEFSPFGFRWKVEKALEPLPLSRGLIMEATRKSLVALAKAKNIGRIEFLGLINKRKRSLVPELRKLLTQTELKLTHLHLAWCGSLRDLADITELIRHSSLVSTLHSLTLRYVYEPARNERGWHLFSQMNFSDFAHLRFYSEDNFRGLFEYLGIDHVQVDFLRQSEKRRLRRLQPQDLFEFPASHSRLDPCLEPLLVF